MKKILIVYILISTAVSFAKVEKKTEYRKPNQVTGDVGFKINKDPAENIDGQFTLTKISLPMQGASTIYQFSVIGDAAKEMFTYMKNPVKKDVESNICTLQDGTSIDVKVQRVFGTSIACRKWPKECWGKVMYKCDSQLDIAKGQFIFE